MTTTARVQLVVDIKVSSTWSDEAAISQVREQATEDAIGTLRQIEHRYDLKVVGDPDVTTVTRQNI